MSRRPRTPWTLARETLLAAVVLALAALNFGHASAVLASGGRVVVTTATSICGDPFAPHDGDHFACHACRSDVAALPPPPAAVEPVCFAVTPVVYADRAELSAGFAVVSPFRARGPPSSI